MYPARFAKSFQEKNSCSSKRLRLICNPDPISYPGHRTYLPRSSIQFFNLRCEIGGLYTEEQQVSPMARSERGDGGYLDSFCAIYTHTGRACTSAILAATSEIGSAGLHLKIAEFIISRWVCIDLSEINRFDEDCFQKLDIRAFFILERERDLFCVYMFHKARNIIDFIVAIGVAKINHLHSTRFPASVRRI